MGTQIQISSENDYLEHLNFFSLVKRISRRRAQNKNEKFRFGVGDLPGSTSLEVRNILFVRFS